MLEAIVDKSITLPQTDPELPAIEQGNANLELTSLLHCSLPTPSSSSGQSHQTRPGKMKRDSNTELLEYLERADERFLQHSKDLNDALLQKLETDTSVFLGHEVVQQTQVKVVRIWDLSLTARLESGTSTRDCLDCQERL
ncbi:uncharacterized protein LOC144462836 isoform X3 [Epinephelus lanceolatus]